MDLRGLQLWTAKAPVNDEDARGLQLRTTRTPADDEDARGLLGDDASSSAFLRRCCPCPAVVAGLTALTLGAALAWALRIPDLDPSLALRTVDRGDASAALGAGGRDPPSLAPGAPDRGPSLFCFALMLSDGYEVQLLRRQFEESAGLFGCDGHSVFSDVPVRLGGAPPVRAEVVPGPLRVRYDPVHNFALNTRVFLRVWSRVFDRGEFRRHDWTAKLDPDAVFLPERLRRRLRRGPSPRAPVYLLNCRLGLRGPIEVLSGRAVEALRDGLGRCHTERASRLDAEGEDVFLEACLELLGVRQVEDLGLLSDARCREQPFPCTADRVAFHPMKRVDRYDQCLAQARGRAGGAPGA